MSGFEKSKFVSLPGGMEEELTCAICLNILNIPMTTPCCRTSYCRKCIQDCLKKPACGSSSCPSCRANLSAVNLQPLPVFVNNILNKLEVYCDNDINGCTEIVKLGELSQHLTRCPFDSKSSTLKCNQLIKNITQSVDRLQIVIKRKDYDNLKKELDILQKEVLNISTADNSNKSKQMSSKDTTKAQPKRKENIVSEHSLIKSARKQLEREEITENNIKTPGLFNKIINLSRQAILDFNDFKQISDYLVDNLSNHKYDWSALIYTAHSTVKLSVIQDTVYNITLHFGDLCITLLSYLSYDDNSDDSDF